MTGEVAAEDGQGTDPRAARLAQQVADGKYCDAVACFAGAGVPPVRVPVARVLVAAASPVLDACFSAAELPDGGVKDDSAASVVYTVASDQKPLELHLPEAVTAAAFRWVVAYACGAVPATWSSDLLDCQMEEIQAAATALAIQDLETWWARRFEQRQASRGFHAASADLGGEEPLRSPLMVGSALLLTATCYAWQPALSFRMRGEMGFFMDDAMIMKNPNVYEEIDWRRLLRTDYWGLEMFTESGWTHKSFRPLTVLTFRLNYWLHSFDSSGFHATNLALHTLCSALLGVVGFSAAGLDLAWSLLLVALFFAHPVHTESVLYIVGRADILCLALILLAVLVYAPCLREGKSGGHWCLVVWRMLVAAVLLVASGLCKETGFCFFGLFAGWEILEGTLSAWTSCPRRLRIVAILAVGACACYARVWYTGGTAIERMDPQSNPIAASGHAHVRALSYALVHGLYAKLLVWPTFLCYDYSLDAVPLVETLRDARLLLPVASYLAFAQLLCLAIHALRASNIVDSQGPIVGMAVLILSFLPMSNVLWPVGTVIGERLLYIPSAGLLLALVALARLGSRCGPRRGRAWAMVLLGAGASGAWLCARRVPEWRSPETITIADGLRQTKSTRVQFNFANVFLHEKRYDEALATYRRAIDLDPTGHDSLPYYHAGQILFYRGRRAEAERHLHAAVSGYYSPLTIKEEEIWHDYGLALWFNEKAEESILNFRKALAINSKFTKALSNLACAAGVGASMGRLPGDHLQHAVHSLDLALAIEPTNVLYWRNAVVLLRLGGDASAASAAWRHVVALDPVGASDGVPRECAWEFYFR